MSRPNIWDSIHRSPINPSALNAFVATSSKRQIACCVALVCSLICGEAAFAQNNVGSSSDWNSAIQAVNSNPNDSFTFNIISNFSMSQQVADINTNGEVLLVGNSHSIDGANLYQPLVIDNGTVAIENLNFINSSAPITIHSGGALIDLTGNLAGNVTNNGAVAFDETSNFTFGGSISGAGQVYVMGGNTVTFTGNNSYTGGTVIENGSTLVTTTSNLVGPVLTNYLLDINQSTDGTFGGNISGSGFLELTGSGKITLTGLNTYSGGTLIVAGATLIGTTSSVQGTLYNYGTVQFNQSTNGTYAGVLTGAGTLEISGSGAITLTGMNGYAGGTLIDAGSTLIGTTDSIVGDITDKGSLQISSGTHGGFDTSTGNTDAVGDYNGNISGTGHVEISGASPVTFTGVNTYSGGTLVDSGSTLIGNTTSIQGAITNNGAVNFNLTAIQTSTSPAVVYSGNMTGSGSVIVSGIGEIAFKGTNSYAGGTTVGYGTQLDGSTSSLQGNIVNNGRVDFNQGPTGTYAGNMSGTGDLVVTGSVNLKLAGTNTYTGTTFIDVGSTVSGSTTSVQGTISNNGTVQFLDAADTSLTQLVHDDLAAGSTIMAGGKNTYAGVMSGAGSVVVGGGGITTFTGANTYSGGTTINSGSTLIGTTSSLQGSFVDNGSLIFSQSTNGLYADKISGSGSVSITGGAIVGFSGANTYTGGTTVATGSTLLGTASSLQGNIINSGSVDFYQTGVGTYAGNMTGAGSVLIAGTGTVNFTGANSYSGGTTVLAGSTLAGTTNGLQGNILDNGTVQFNQTTAGTFGGVISGTGGVQIAGRGPITLDTVNTYSGGTIIGNGSTLIVGSTGSIGDVTINNGGILQGQGNVGNVTVAAGGTIYPGTVGAPITINGNFNQTTGTTYSAELSPTQSDKIIVTGIATINTGTTLNLVVDSGTYTVGSKYDILTAAGGLNGTYSNVSTTSYTQSVVFNEHYDANNLQISVSSDLQKYAQSPNQIAVASLLDQVSGTATGALATDITMLTTLSPSQTQTALNQLSGDIYPSLSSIQRQTTTMQMQLISNRLAGLSGPGSTSTMAMRNGNSGVRLVSSQLSNSQSAPASTTKSLDWTTWAQGYGLGGNIAGNGDAGGVNYHLGGTMFGVERWLTDNTLVGVLGGFAANSVGNGQDGSNAQISTYQVGLYEMHRDDFFYLSNIDTFNNDNYSTSRLINLGAAQLNASGSSSGMEWAHYTELGTTLDFDDIRVQPFTDVQYMYLDQHGYSESGAGPFNMSVSNQVTNSVRNGIGARIYRETTWREIVLTPTLLAHYQHEWGNGTSLITTSYSGIPTSQFTVAGTKTGRDFALLSFGSTAYVNDRFSIFGSIDAQVAQGYYAVVGSGGFKYSW